jgi:lysyl-tRNA synthetase class 2
MTDWRPTSRPDVARRRADMLERARDYFARQSILAVDTPALSRFASSDPGIDSFAVHPLSGANFYLNTSPEYCMKRLLADGYPDIYSISRVYRDGEFGSRHQPEFTLLEWYRLGFDLEAIIADTLKLIATCLQRTDLLDITDIHDYATAFRSFAGIDVFESSINELAKCAESDATLRNSMGDDRDAWLDLIMDIRIAPQFAPDRLTVLQHFPASKAALARLCPDNNKVADRFEVFYGPMELANGYVELTDADEQRRRFTAELDKRRASGRTIAASDPQLLQALAAGLPDCAGVAVGIERLHMTYERVDDIAAVVTFAQGSPHG